MLAFRNAESKSGAKRSLSEMPEIPFSLFLSPQKGLRLDLEFLRRARSSSSDGLARVPQTGLSSPQAPGLCAGAGEEKLVPQTQLFVSSPDLCYEKKCCHQPNQTRSALPGLGGRQLFFHTGRRIRPLATIIDSRKSTALQKSACEPSINMTYCNL